MSYQVNAFSSKDDLDLNLANTVAEKLEAALKAKGHASIAVSGGRTPKAFFEQLSQKPLDWANITITLADDRWVETNSDDSNDRLVREALLVNNAKDAKFVSLKQGDEPTDDQLATIEFQLNDTVLPFDVLILGMGEDGHTASLFPCSDEISQAMCTMNGNKLMAVKPKTAPYQRVTFTFKTLISSDQIILHITGAGKKTVLDKAIENKDVLAMPISAFLHHDEKNVDVFWAE